MEEKHVYMTQKDVYSLMETLYPNEVICILVNDELYMLDRELICFISYKDKTNILDLTNKDIYGHDKFNRVILPLIVFKTMDNFLDFIVDEKESEIKDEIQQLKKLIC